ncbi:tRNA (adenosine(37)-N6)-dimethylallyltransferase MiaA [Alkalibacterium kapii]|uniref:tRNA (adenosine(37)-N6)-dimethylallyltransferase MiaA n=1 Tax=Alkalibacterium kapii TaxID=426704 RepID=UPI0011BEDCC4|nr:tRNA (adenosine(37)-N6)-dimethylallyltransferase MiaA [Alkalibacterium kapii]
MYVKEKIIVIVGPTAVGKTQLGIALAKAFNGEVINGDSMQVNNQLDIGTAKVTDEEADGVPHHLIDIKSPAESYTVSDFKKDGREKIQEVITKGKLPIIVGGTGLYIESLLYDVTHGGKAEPNPAFRDEMNRLAHDKGREALHQLLQDKDPQAAERIHQNNVRRVIRALEVMHETGKKFSDHQNECKKEPLYDAYVIALNTDRDVLYDRINKRVELMLAKGLLEEVRWLYESFPGDLQSKKGIGYKEFDAYLQGDQSFDEAVSLIKQHSRNYAKRQLTWFKNRFKVNQWDDLVAHPEELEKIKNSIQNFIEGD